MCILFFDQMFPGHVTIEFSIKTFRSSCKILREKYFGTVLKAVARFVRQVENWKNIAATHQHIWLSKRCSCHVWERRKTSMQYPWNGQRLEIVVIRNAP